MRDLDSTNDQLSPRILAERCARAMACAPGSGPVSILYASIAAHEAATLRWALRFGLTNERSAHRLAHIGCGSFAAHTYAGKSRELVQLGADLIAWLYLFDDVHGESGDEEAFAAAVSVARGTASTLQGSPFMMALADICWRAGARAGVGWCDRFAAALEFFFDGCRRELPYRASRQVPGFLAYREVKQRSVGAAPVFALLQLDSPLTAQEAAGAALQALNIEAALLCAWVNDVFSFEKEYAAGDPLNVVQVLAAEGQLSLTAAFDEVAALYRRESAAFTSHAEEFLAAERSEAERRYLRSLMTWVRGNLAWTETSGRYSATTQYGQAA